MVKNASITPLNGRDKLVVSGMCLLFGLAFAAVVIFSVVGLVTELGGWYSGRTWQPAMAEIGETNLRRTGRKGGALFASASYRYSVNGVDFNGRRLGWSDGIWIAFSDWHEDVYHELEETKNEGKRALIWYDPANPGMAVIDRELRWGLLFFLVPLGLLFAAPSVAAFWILRNLWRRQ